jgi:serine/threonine protein phosphatase PrpC
MSDDQDKEVLPKEVLPWRILSKSVRGASHFNSGKPNQDAIHWNQDKYRGLPLMLAIADGHGGEKYFRSDVGARLAVQAAVEEMKNFEKGLLNQPLSQSLSAVEADAEHLPWSIVSRWRELVKQHREDNGFTPGETERIEKKENADPTLPYGATLLAVLVTESFILYLQLGDGDILTISSSEKVTRPIPDDERLLANETTSLCNPTAARDFRTYFQRLMDPKPTLIMLSTDGYSNSFRNPEGFLKVGTDIWNMIRSDGLQKVEENLEEWLTLATQRGSGDDMTLGLLCRMSALKEEVKLNETFIQPVKAKMLDESSHIDGRGKSE